MIRSLGDLRARRKGGTGRRPKSWVFEAAFAAIGWTSLALAIAAGVSGGWLTGTVALFLGFVALCLVFIVGAVLASALLPEKPSEAVGFAAATTAVAFYAYDRYGALSLVPPAVAVLMFALHGLQYGRAGARTTAATRHRDLPTDVEEMLVGLPEHLDARLRGPVDRALADCAALKAAIEALTTAEAGSLPIDVEPQALVRDAHTALREMARRAAAAQALVEALSDAPSAPVEAALAAAVQDLDAQATEVRGAREAWLLFQAARVGDRVAQVDGLRRRAEALRAMGQAMGEVERVR